MSVKRKNLDASLAEVLKQFITIKDADFNRSQEVFKSVFDQVKQKMGEKCNYFNKYSSQVLKAGSVYDGIKVSKMDEFDMDIVIRLPISYEDGDNGVIIENQQPGFIKMKIINAFDNLDKQQEWEKTHKVTREWRDDEKYFLQNKFRQWMHSIVQKALNDMDGKVNVNGVIYLVTYKESGPAYTLNIRNDKDSELFTLDVDLVPVIRFMLPRWPKGYKKVEGSTIKEWLVVPKPIKTAQGVTKNRCWRLSFQDFEKDLIKGCQQLKNTIRLVKKLRDALGMKAIASYYIKTIFLWKVENSDKKFWQNKLSVTFRTMVFELCEAITKGNIPYFWQKDNNLIDSLKPTLQAEYVKKLKEVLFNIDNNEVDKVVAALLTTNEFSQFKMSEFYQKQTVSRSESTVSRSESTVDPFKDLNNKLDQINKFFKTNMVELRNKMDELLDKIESQNERIKILEMKGCNTS